MSDSDLNAPPAWYTIWRERRDRDDETLTAFLADIDHDADVTARNCGAGPEGAIRADMAR
jgi:hypothetical protein